MNVPVVRVFGHGEPLPALGRAVGAQLGVLVPVAGHGGCHPVRGPPVVAVGRGHLGEALLVLAGKPLEPAEDLVADHHPERPAVRGDVGRRR